MLINCFWKNNYFPTIQVHVHYIESTLEQLKKKDVSYDWNGSSNLSSSVMLRYDFKMINDDYKQWI